MIGFLALAVRESSSRFQRVPLSAFWQVVVQVASFGFAVPKLRHELGSFYGYNLPSIIRDTSVRAVHTTGRDRVGCPVRGVVISGDQAFIALQAAKRAQRRGLPHRRSVVECGQGFAPLCRRRYPRLGCQGPGPSSSGDSLARGPRLQVGQTIKTMGEPLMERRLYHARRFPGSLGLDAVSLKPGKKWIRWRCCTSCGNDRLPDTTFYVALRFFDDTHHEAATNCFEEHGKDLFLWTPWHRVEVFVSFDDDQVALAGAAGLEGLRPR